METYGLESVFECVGILRLVRGAAKVTREELTGCDFDSIGIKSLSEVYQLGQQGLNIEIAFSEKHGDVAERRIKVAFILSHDDDNFVDVIFTHTLGSEVWQLEQYRSEETDDGIADRLIEEAMSGVNFRLFPKGSFIISDAFGKIAKIAANVRAM